MAYQIHEVADGDIIQASTTIEQDTQIKLNEENIEALSNGKIAEPQSEGTNGQVLTTDGNGGRSWTSPQVPTDAQVQSAVNDWLDDHPEATTTVEDGSISYSKLDTTLKGKADDIDSVKSSLVLVQANQPTEAVNKLWVDSDTVEETEVPTMEEFSVLKSAINVLQSGTEVLYSGTVDGNSSVRSISKPLVSGGVYCLKITPSSDVGSKIVYVGTGSRGEDQSLGTYTLQSGVTVSIIFTANGAWDKMRVPNAAYNVSASIYDYAIKKYIDDKALDLNGSIDTLDGRIDTLETSVGTIGNDVEQAQDDIELITIGYYKKQAQTIADTDNVKFTDLEGQNAVTSLVTLARPTQSGTGVPSFSNLRTISGIDSVDYTNSGNTETFDFVDQSENTYTVYYGTIDLVTGVATIQAILQSFNGSSIDEYVSATVPYVKVKLSSPLKRNTGIDIISNAFTYSGVPEDGIVYVRSWSSPKFELYSNSFTSESEAVSIMNSKPVQVLYPVEPFTVQLNKQSILTLQGENDITVSTGNFSITYYQSFRGAVESIANANGTEGGYGLSSDALLYLSEVPTYYGTVTAATPTTYDEAYSYLERRINSIPQGRSFIFLTDTHWAGNQKHSTQLINYVRKRTGIRKVLFGGDILGNSDTPYIFVKTGGDYLMQSRQAFGHDYLPAVGDHDSNSNLRSGNTIEQQWLPYAQMARMFVGDLAGTAHFYQPTEKLATYATGNNYTECLAFFKTVYYVDDDLTRIRYIILNNGNNGVDYGAMHDVFGGSGSEVLRLQFDWLAETLMSTQKGYDIVVLGHKINQQSSAGNVVEAMLSAFVRKVSNFYPHPTSAGGNAIDTWWPNTTTYDFSDAPDVGRILQMNGHTHKDSQSWFGLDANNDYRNGVAYDGETVLNQRTKGQIPTTNTQTDAAANVDSPEATPMTVGTVTEQCFDVVTFNDDGIFFTRFGAGSDRHFYME